MSRRKWTQREIELWRKEHGDLAYNNREDKNLFVPRSLGLGWGLNWGNPWSWVVMAVIIGILLFGVLYGKQIPFIR